MADTDSHNPEELGYGMLRQDVPEMLVDAVLDQQRKEHIFFRFTLDDWESLRLSRPNIVHYMSTTSFEAAPNDPIMREKITAALLGLWALLDEAITNEKLEDKLNGAGDA
jgi:hypothetical protein